jgi:hypothetical protein
MRTAAESVAASSRDVLKFMVSGIGGRFAAFRKKASQGRGGFSGYFARSQESTRLLTNQTVFFMKRIYGNVSAGATPGLVNLR